MSAEKRALEEAEHQRFPIRPRGERLPGFHAAARELQTKEQREGLG